MKIERTIFLPQGGWIWIFDVPHKVVIEESDGSLREAPYGAINLEIAGKNRLKGKKQHGAGSTAPGVQSRLVRVRDAPGYLGMDENRFNAEVRPHMTEIPIGKQGIGFDRLDLDAWVEDYKSRNGRPGKRKGVSKPWDENKSPASSTVKGSGTSTKLSEEEEFARALAKVTSQRQKRS